MLFNSLTYLLFLVAVVPGFWFCPNAAKRGFLLATSALFYCWWDWHYGFLLAGSIVLNFLLGLFVERFRGRLVIGLAVALNLGVLAYFKYLGFLLQSLSDLIGLVTTHTNAISVPSIALPIGISFFTFQGLSYVIDVHRGHSPAVRSVLDLALFKSFWPQLVAGPIVRAQELIPQFVTWSKFTYDHLATGLRLLFTGLFLKVFLADGIAGFVDEGFSVANYARNSSIDNWTLAFGFGFQIYFDFAGYSLVALGSARLVGIVLPQNFNFPYIAASPREFWQRWHITLSSWIRDYLYIPLQGLVAMRSAGTGGLDTDARSPSASRFQKSLALLLTWMLMGLWHGASWTFVIWGLWHALLVLGYRGLIRVGKAVPSFGVFQSSKVAMLLGHVLTLGAVMSGWIWFRAGTVKQATSMLATMFSPTSLKISYKENFYLVTFLLLGCFYAAYFIDSKVLQKPRVQRFGWPVHAICYVVMVNLALAFLRSRQQFIYFQF